MGQSSNVLLELPRNNSCSYILQPMDAPGPEIKAVVLTESGSKGPPSLGLVQKQTSEAFAFGTCALQPAEKCPEARKSRGSISMNMLDYLHDLLP